MVRKAKARKQKPDPKRLPYAEEARDAAAFVEFFTDDLPAFILRQSDTLTHAWAASDLFNALSALPDRKLKQMGLARVDISPLVLSAFHLVHIARKRKRAAARRRTTAKRAAKKS
jgi:hypothetical protein